MSTKNRKSATTWSSRQGGTRSNAMYFTASVIGKFGPDEIKDALLADVDPAYSIKVHGLRAKRAITSNCIQTSPLDTGLDFSEWKWATIDREDSLWFVDESAETKCLPAAMGSSGFAFGGRTVSVSLNAFLGRVVDLDEDTVGTIVQRVGTGGRLDDEVAVRLSASHFPAADRLRLRLGALFEWTIKERSWNDGETDTKTRIALLPERPLDVADQRAIDRRAAELLAALEDDADE